MPQAPVGKITTKVWLLGDLENILETVREIGTAVRPDDSLETRLRADGFDAAIDAIERAIGIAPPRIHIRPATTAQRQIQPRSIIR